MQKEYDIIIVGGGFAGITAARELSQAGKSVLVLEAKDHLGGRALSSELNDVPIELGGGYVFWSQPHVWAEIHRYSLTIKERPYYARTNAMQETRFLINGAVRKDFTEVEKNQIAAAFEEYVAPAKSVFPLPFTPFLTEAYKKYDGLSNADRINQMELTELQRTTLLRTTNIQCNNSPTEGGYIEALRWYALANGHDDTYADSLSRFSLKEGTTHLLNCIVKDTKAVIKLNSLVTEINQTDEQVTISTGSTTYISTSCIVATPLNTWKNIQFTPTISSEKLNFSKEELSGKGNKIYIELAGKFRDNRWSSINTPILSILPHYVGEEKSIVVAFTNPAHPMKEVTVATLQAEIAKWDDTYQVTDFAYHDWSNDPLALGTWGNFKPNQFTNYFKNALQPEGNIYFAGGDIALGWRGFIDGAIESGIKVARQIIKRSLDVSV